MVGPAFMDGLGDYALDTGPTGNSTVIYSVAPDASFDWVFETCNTTAFAVLLLALLVFLVQVRPNCYHYLA